MHVTESMRLVQAYHCAVLNFSPGAPDEKLSRAYYCVKVTRGSLAAI